MTSPVQPPHEPDHRRHEEHQHARPRRRADESPAQFRAAYSGARKSQASGARAGAAAGVTAAAVGTPTVLQADLAWLMGIDQPRPGGILTSITGLTTGLDQTAQTQRQQQPATPQQALQLVADEAAKTSKNHDMREVHLQLEPEHLGPLVIRLHVQGGKIRAALYARDATAVQQLAEGSDALRNRLSQLGFSDAEVIVEQREEGWFEPIESG